MRFSFRKPRLAWLLAACALLSGAQQVSAQVTTATYSVSGANIRSNGQSRVWRGANAFHVFGPNASLMNSWGIDIVREAVSYAHIVDLTGGGKASPGGGWLHSLQNVVTDNANNGKITILCPFSWDGSSSEFTGRNPRQTTWWNDYKTKISAWATQFKSQPNVWIELWNEPYTWDGSNGYTDAMWQQDMAEIVDLIRSSGNNNIIVVPVAGQGGDEGVLTRTNSSGQQYGRLIANKGNIVFDTHAYESWLPTGNIDARIQTIRNNNYAMIFGEVGPYNTSTLMNVNPLLDAARRRGSTVLGWCFDSTDADRLTTTGSTPNDSNNNNWGSTFRAFTLGARLPDGTYSLSPACAPGSNLDAQNWGTANGTKVQIWSSGTGTNQKWVLTNVGGGYYKITPSYASSVALDVNAASAQNGTVVQLWTDNSSTAQKWQLVPNTDGTYALRPQCAPSSALNVPGGVSTNGTGVTIQTDSGASSQRWTFNPS